MTRLEALKAALRAAVRDGETEVARELTKIVAEVSAHKYPSNAIAIFPKSRPRKRFKESVPTLGRFDDTGKS